MTGQMIYLLATGPIPAEMPEEARQRGVLLESMEFIRIENLAGVPEIKQLLDQPLTVVFTSVNAVDAVGKELNGHVPDWRVYCIDGATCAAVGALFGKNVVVGTA